MDVSDEITGVFTAAFIIYFYFQLLSNVTTTIDLDTGLVRTNVDFAQIFSASLEASVVASRAFGRVEYDAVAYDPGTGAVVVEGFEFTRRDPFSDAVYDVSIDALSISASDGGDDLLDLRIDVLGFEAPLDSVEMPSAARAQLAALGVDALRADATIDVNYDLSSSAAEVAVALDVADIGAVSAAGEFGRLHFVDVEFGDGRLDGEVRAITLSFEDLGALDAGLALLGVPSGAAGADDVEALVRAQTLALLAADPSTGRETAPTRSAQAFADDLAVAAARVVGDADAITVSARPAEPIGFVAIQELIDRVGFDLGARIRLLDALQPAAGAAPTPVAPILVAAPSPDAPAADRLAAARAYLTGLGAPRDADTALALLEGLGSPSAEALALLADAYEAVAGRPTVAAYEAALLAEAAGAENAGGRVLRLRAALSLAEMLDGEALAADRAPISAAIDALLARADDGDPLAMRALSNAFSLGDGAPRSVLEAYRWATLGAAAGDRPAQRRRDAIAALYARSDASEAWREALRDVEALASEQWSAGLGDAVRARVGD